MYEWDLSVLNGPSHQEMIDAISEVRRTIYRASITLGMPVDSVRLPLTRFKSPENEIEFLPDSLSFEIGPIECRMLNSLEDAQLGWMALQFSGYGYLYPWTLRDIVERAEGSEEVSRIMSLCQSHWPVIPEKPNEEQIMLRRRFRKVFPYDPERLADWGWSAYESG